ncbi:MAG: hypothetical protein WA211_12890 [Candidatus Acidiferrales bacterium]
MGDVLRDGTVPAHMQSEAVDSGVLAVVKQGESILIPGNHPPKQQTVV